MTATPRKRKRKGCLATAETQTCGLRLQHMQGRRVGTKRVRVRMRNLMKTTATAMGKLRNVTENESVREYDMIGEG